MLPIIIIIIILPVAISQKPTIDEEKVIDIKGIDKVELLNALWLNSKPASFYRASGTLPPDFDKEKAETAVYRYIDYFCGHAIKTDISGDTASTYLYDRDTRPGRFRDIVDAIRTTTKTEELGCEGDTTVQKDTSITTPQLSKEDRKTLDAEYAKLLEYYDITISTTDGTGKRCQIYVTEAHDAIVAFCRDHPTYSIPSLYICKDYGI